MSIRRRDQTGMGPNNLRDKRSAILNLSANSQTLEAVVAEPDSPAELASWGRLGLATTIVVVANAPGGVMNLESLVIATALCSTGKII